MSVKSKKNKKQDIFFSKKEIMKNLVKNGKKLNNIKVILVEGTEASGKTTFIKKYYDDNKHIEDITILSDWTFLPKIQNYKISSDLTKEKILELNEKDRAFLIKKMRVELSNFLLKEDEKMQLLFQSVKDSSVLKPKTFLIDRGFFSTIVLHDLENIQWLVKVFHVLPNNIFLLKEEPNVIKQRIENRENNNALDNIDLKEITNQIKLFDEAVILYSEALQN